jgi:hypothetical protein
MGLLQMCVTKCIHYLKDVHSYQMPLGIPASCIAHTLFQNEGISSSEFNMRLQELSVTKYIYSVKDLHSHQTPLGVTAS